MTSRVEVSLCHLAEEALGSTGCGVGRCSRYLAESQLVLCVEQIYGLVKLSKKNARPRAHSHRSQTVTPMVGELRSPSVTRVTPINSRSWVASPWAAHVDRLGFHGELHFFPRFLGQFHQHRQPLAGRRARCFKANLNNNSSVFKATIHT